MLVRSKNLASHVPGPKSEPGSANISLRISNPAIFSSGISQLARLIRPALAVEDNYERNESSMSLK